MAKLNAVTSQLFLKVVLCELHVIDKSVLRTPEQAEKFALKGFYFTSASSQWLSPSSNWLLSAFVSKV